MASDDNSPVPSPSKQKGISRRKKSASQTELLEKAYAEDKYPSEPLRVELSKELGLSEKQLQIWFTHRRHKDRRDGIEDFKLTFYASRNKGDMPNEEPQSARKGEIDLNSREEDDSEDGYPAAVLAEERDDDVLIAEQMNGINAQNGGCKEKEKEKDKPKPAAKKKGAPKDPSKPPKKPGPKPKPKLNALAPAELEAIQDVERQLCGPMREDGPPLAFEFDPLPPGALHELTSTPGLHAAGGSREGGSESYCERAAIESKWGKEPVLEKKKRKVGGLSEILRQLESLFTEGGNLKSRKGESR